MSDLPKELDAGAIAHRITNTHDAHGYDVLDGVNLGMLAALKWVMTAPKYKVENAITALEEQR